MNNTITITDLTQYRMYLRYNYYPIYNWYILDELKKLPLVLDAVFDEATTTITIRLRKRKTEALTSELADIVSRATLTSLHHNHINAIIYSDPRLDTKTKQKYMNIQQILSSPDTKYIATMYNMIIVDQSVIISL